MDVRTQRRELIERFVRERKVLKAKEEILLYLRSAGRSSSAKFEACEWYRRLGLFSEAYRLVRWEDRLPTKVAAESSAGRRLLWSSWMLNALGAGSVATSFLNRLIISQAADHRIAAEIFFTQFQPRSALLHYRRMMKLDSDPAQYASRLSRVGYADALSADQNYDEAIRVVREIYAQSHEPLLKGICLSAEGEYLARAGHFVEGLRQLEAAQGAVPGGENSPDRAFLEKWLGYCLAKTGKPKEGEALLLKAENFFREKSVRPEVWGDIVRLRVEAGLAKSAEANRLVQYPGWDPGFLKLLPESGQTSLGPVDARIEIDRKSNEYRIQEKRFLGVPKELELLAALRIAEDWGFSIPSAITWLWPDEAFAFLELEDRLFQLLRRLRSRYQISFNVVQRRIYLDPKSYSECRVVVSGSVDKRPLFLRTRHAPFCTQDINAFYGLQKSAAALWLQKWLERHWIKRVGKGRSTQYEINLPK